VQVEVLQTKYLAPLDCTSDCKTTATVHS